MKKILFYSPIAVFAFVLSLYGVHIFNFFTQMPKVEVPEEPPYLTACSFGLSEVEIEYKYTVRGGDFSNAVFLVTNSTDNPVFFDGYEKKYDTENWIRRTSSGEYMLKSGKSATFTMPVSKNEKSFEAQFDVYYGDSDKPVIYTVDVGKQKVFVETSRF